MWMSSCQWALSHQFRAACASMGVSEHTCWCFRSISSSSPSTFVCFSFTFNSSSSLAWSSSSWRVTCRSGFTYDKIKQFITTSPSCGFLPVKHCSLERSLKPTFVKTRHHCQCRSFRYAAQFRCKTFKALNCCCFLAKALENSKKTYYVKKHLS